MMHPDGSTCSVREAVPHTCLRRLRARFAYVVIVLCLVVPSLHAQPVDPDGIELPVMSRLTGWITKRVGVAGSAEEFGQSVMPLFAQSDGLPGIMVRHNRADTIARGTYPVESLFYPGRLGRFPDSSDRQRIGLTEIGSEGRLLCAGDWDADGYRDLAMWLRIYKDSTYGGQDYRPGRVVIFWGNPREEYSFRDTSRLFILTEQWIGARTASNQDFSGDGVQDLFIYGGGGMQDGSYINTAEIHIFRGRMGQRWGQNGMQCTPDWSLWKSPPHSRLAVVDQDKDGSFDIIFHDDQSSRSATVSVMYGRHGALPDTTDVETIDLTVANGHFSLFSDVTGDTVPELLVNTGTPEVIRIYAGAPGQRLKQQYGSGFDPPQPGKGFWRRPWAEVWLPNKLDDTWIPAGWGPLIDLGDANHDGINDIWAYSEPYLICYAGGRFLDSLVDAVVTVPGTEFISAANVGDISGMGRPALAIGYDWIPHESVNPFPGGVMFVRTDTSFTTNSTNPRRLPVTTSDVAVSTGEGKGVLATYPNPAHDRVTVRWNGLPSGRAVRLSVVNVLGEDVLSAAVDALSDGIELDLKTLPPGHYRIVLRTPTSTHSTSLLRY